MSNENATDWEGMVPDLNRVFPERGRVFWYDVPRSVEERSLYQFEVEEHPLFDADTRLEAFQVRNWNSITEVVDLRGFESEELVRRLLTGEGLHGVPAPIASDVLIWLNDGLWLGPIHPSSTAHDAWVIDPGTQLNKIQAWQLDTDTVSTVEVQGRRIITRPGKGVRGTLKGIRNWAPDEEVARTILKRIRKLNPGVAEALGQTHKAFDTYLEVLKHTQILGPDLEQELARRARVSELMKTVEANADLLQEAVASLMASGSVRAELEERKRTEYEWIRAEAEQRVQGELAARNQDIATVETTLRERREELAALERRLSEYRAEVQEQLASFESELSVRLHELSTRPERLFAEAAILKALVPGAANGRFEAAATVPVIPPAESVSVTRIANPKELGALLVDRLQFHGINAAASIGLRTCLISGLVPIVTGPRAYEALASFAATFAGGRLTWIPVSGSTFEPQDLFGKFDVHSGRIVPHPGGLLSEIVGAERTDGLRLIVLDGFNRGATDSYLVPLLESYSDATSGRTPREIPLADRGLLNPNDPYFSRARVKWPSNVLLACVPASGSSALPVSADIWKHATLVVCDSDELADPGSVFRHPGTVEEVTAITEIEPTAWSALQSAARQVPLAELADSLLRSLVPLGIAVEPVIRRYAAARAFGTRHEGALRSAVLEGVVPQVPDRLDELARLIPSDSGIAREDLEAVAAVIRKLSQ
jgi:hypothetical protein